MFPFLTYPLALIALASLPALAAIYILRNRFRRRRVSSLMLWRFRVQSKEGGTRVNRIQLPLLFFLELLALSLLAVAAAGPHWKLPQATRPMIVVLDDSFSMRAVSADRSARDRARDFLKSLFRLQAPPSTRLVLAGIEPRLLGAPTRNWSETEKLLDQWTCHAPLSALDSAITLASELGRHQANVLVLTDHPFPDSHQAGNRLEWRAFGARVPNTAIVGASRTANGDRDRCLLEIANDSPAATLTELLVRAGSNTVQRTPLALGPRDQQRVVFDIPAGTPMLEAELNPDALDEDNRVELLPPVRKRVRVQVALTNAALSELVDKTLDATGLRASIRENPELIIHQSDSSPDNNAWSLCWRIPAKAAAYTGPFIVDRSHPMAAGLELEGVIWAAAATTNAPEAMPLVLAGNTPLLSARADVLGRQFLTLNLDPDLSTIQTTPDWPILFWNLLAWRASKLPGLMQSNARIGTDVILQTAGEPATVTWPDGTVKRFPGSGDQLSLETPLAGLYSVVMGSATNRFAVNPLAADESDLSACATGRWGKWTDDIASRYAQSPMAWIFALAALGILAGHLWLVAAGKGGGR
jgi:Aerotolerance regulator N-terminal